MASTYGALPYYPLTNEGTNDASKVNANFQALESLSLATVTAYARTLLDDADAATARATLGLGITDTPQFASVGVGRAPTCALDLYSVNASVSAAIISGLTTGNADLYMCGSGNEFNVKVYGATATGTWLGQNRADSVSILSNTASRMMIGTRDAAELYLGTANAAAITVSTTQAVTCASTVKATGYLCGTGTGLASQVVALAKLTAGGSNGSITITGGIVTAYTAPT